MPNPLEALLRRRIAQQGPLSFRDVMEAALYHPQHGYYVSLRGFGPGGDFITAPELHPVFGLLVGRQALDLWEALGRPRPFRLLEVGGGSGALAAALLRWARAEAPALAAALAYAIDERSPSLRQVQRRALAGLGVRWGWPAEAPHLLLANEVLDAFPVHRVVVRGGELRELRVGLAPGGGLGWVEAASVPAAVAAYFAALGRLPPEGAVAEVNLGLAEWAHRLARRLERGLALVVDYGDLADELLQRPAGTLLTYYRHTLGSDPLVRLGRQDISAHVDFTTLASAAAAAGLQVLGLTDQATLLGNLGLQQYRARLPAGADRRALAALVDRQGLGRLRALFLGRGLGSYVPAGLSGGRSWDTPDHLPALPAEPPPDDFLDQWREAIGAATRPGTR